MSLVQFTYRRRHGNQFEGSHYRKVKRVRRRDGCEAKLTCVNACQLRRRSLLKRSRLAAVQFQVMSHTRSGIHVLSGAARWRGWLVGAALLAVFAFLLQPECYAWATEQGPARVTAQKGSGADECCVIAAIRLTPRHCLPWRAGTSACPSRLRPSATATSLCPPPVPCSVPWSIHRIAARRTPRAAPVCCYSAPSQSFPVRPTGRTRPVSRDSGSQLDYDGPIIRLVSPIDTEKELHHESP